ncbi:MAG TPA: hypothetical protein VNQ90_15515 [Chthoniobacteraceae bacterium]|nr:hypothetical protein [Chthoniobacteraceae bacterium]
MICPSCDSNDEDCFECNGYGWVCDDCGEATNETGMDICDECHIQKQKSEGGVA